MIAPKGDAANRKVNDSMLKLKPKPIDHYENFPLASWLCPPKLRYAVSAVYHFARTADDLADEGEQGSVQRIDDLSEYRADLNLCLSELNSKLQGPDTSSKRWPHIFGPLGIVIKEFQIPPELLHRLLDAFEQDVLYSAANLSYKNREELIQYCHKSAAPIGRIMLRLFNQEDPKSLSQSDSICCALQLINFWQDISIDILRNRFYLPVDSTLEKEIAFAKKLMHAGAPLCLSIGGRAGWELRAVVQGGLRMIEKIERVNTHLIRHRLTRLDYVLIAWRCCFKSSFSPTQHSSSNPPPYPT